ncbi:MAG: RluA family pseudouridine synthase [Desulfovibrionaceae bacterium]|nr:RluA family pseudouridine synthase [Desulfovibrionaceae bacterium]
MLHFWTCAGFVVYMRDMGGSEPIVIGRAEAGQSLLRFLVRRLGLPKALLYRWLRSGQIRVNSGRCKADRFLEEGDALRLPPLAAILAPAAALGSGGRICLPAPGQLGEDLPILYQDEGLLVMDKPAGLAVQGGSGQVDSVCARLRRICAGAGCFVPAPAHRLDKPASGLLLAGKTQAALRRLHAWQLERQWEKEYLGWVKGDFSPLVEGGGWLTMKDLLPAAEKGRSGEKGVLNQEALAYCRFLEKRRISGAGDSSLLLVKLDTGRKHQIRRQLAGRGFPLVGDLRYQGPAFPRLLLHAFRLRLPLPLTLHSLPDWPAPYSVGINMPESVFYTDIP